MNRRNYGPLDYLSTFLTHNFQICSPFEAKLIAQFAKGMYENGNLVC